MGGGGGNIGAGGALAPPVYMLKKALKTLACEVEFPKERGNDIRY